MGDLCGIDINYSLSSGGGEAATIEFELYDDNAVIITTTCNINDALNAEHKNEEEHIHDFIAGTDDSWESYDDGSHWAVCDCGFQLQVPHRPTTGGICMDCNVGQLEGEYENTYSFEIPADCGWDEDVERS